MATPLRPQIELPAFGRVRRNHGLEHASIHVLSGRHPGLRLAGHSDSRGFWLLGELSAEQVRAGVQEALTRLRSGESHLAIHPNCGTNLVTSGLAAGVAGAVAMAGSGPRSRDKLGRLPLAGLLATAALLLARPLGTRLQQYVTTSGDPGDLEILDIRPQKRVGVTAHRVSTRS